MTTEEYLAALEKLGLTVASQKTAAALGVSVRQLQRYAAGETIPRPAALLLEALTAPRGKKRKPPCGNS